MHATIDVRFELSIDDDKTLPLATLAEAVTDQNLEAVLLESLVESLDAASASRRSVVRNTHMATVTSASNAPAPTPAQLSQLPENTSSLSTTSKIQPLPQTNPATSGPSKTFSTSTGRTAISGTSPPKRRSRYLAQLSRRCQSRRQLRLDAVADHHQPPCQNTATSSNSSFQTVSLARTLTPSFLTGQSATAKTTTARPTPSKQRSAKTPPKSHAPCWICRSTLTGTKLPPNSMISAQSLTTRRSSVTLIAASSQPLPTKTVTTSSDLVHVGRTLGYTLWDDGVFSLDRRKEIVSGGDRRGVPSEELCGEASSSGGVRGDPLADRANEKRLEKTAWQLEQFGSAKAAGYLRRWLPSIVTFAEHAVEGFEVPWTSNPVERLMGEVSKRCKNQWMRWTAEGLEAILQLRLVKYADPEYYQAFLDELLQRSTKTAINCDLSIESTSGKV